MPQCLALWKTVVCTHRSPLISYCSQSDLSNINRSLALGRKTLQEAVDMTGGLSLPIKGLYSQKIGKRKRPLLPTQTRTNHTGMG